MTSSGSSYVDPLPWDDPLVEGIRRHLVVSCEHRIAGETVYTLGLSEGGRYGWVFAHRAGVAYAFSQVDDPRGLFEALTVESDGADAMVQGLVEAILLDRFQTLSRPSTPGQPRTIAPELSAADTAEFAEVGRDVLRMVREEFPATVTDPDLEHMWQSPGANPLSRQDWSSRPFGDVRLSELLRSRTRDSVHGSLALRDARNASAKGAAALVDARNGQGPELVALLGQRDCLQEALHHLNAAVRAENAAAEARDAAARARSWAAELRVRAGRPALLNRLTGTDPHRLLATARSADADAGRLLEMASVLSTEAVQERSTARSLVPAGTDPRQAWDELMASWEGQVVHAAENDLASAERYSQLMEVKAADLRGEAAARGRRAQDADAELALRASLPVPDATVEFLSREELRARLIRTGAPARSPRLAQQRQQPPPEPGQTPGRRR